MKTVLFLMVTGFPNEFCKNYLELEKKYSSFFFINTVSAKMTFLIKFHITNTFIF